MANTENEENGKISIEKRLRFRTPVRRLTRQRSGFTVGGETTGSECKIKKSARMNISKKDYKIKFTRDNIIVKPIFLKNQGFLAFGGYINPEKDLSMVVTLKTMIEGVEETETSKIDAVKGNWNKFGILHLLSISKAQKIDNVEATINFISSEASIGKFDMFGFEIGAIEYKYFLENDIEIIFNEKLGIYLPEIFYFKQDDLGLIPQTIKNFDEGQPLVIKSCNRCSRFLAIDALNERNTLSFSNHCVKRVPCSHIAFSSYSIVESDYSKIPPLLTKLNNDGKIQMYYGFQLECKSCKKFFVNAPLNPLRNSTQHREDSLRRRAIEVLVDTLLNREWIYHKFRLEKRKEFDKHIWEKFGKKCFKCNKKLKNEREMDLDHTMPLASFWPLDETATCLCNRCNSLKSDKFPIEFYSNKELDELTKVTGINIRILKSKKINLEVVEKLIERIEWFFDDFLNNKDYQKIRNGKRTSDLIYKAIMKQLRTFYKNDIDLVEIYKKKLGRNPYTRVRKVFC